MNILNLGLDKALATKEEKGLWIEPPHPSLLEGRPYPMLLHITEALATKQKQPSDKSQGAASCPTYTGSIQ